MKILSAIMLAAALTLAGLAASPASGVVSPETAAAAERADAESRVADLNLDVRPIVAGCRVDAGYPQLHFDRCVANRVNIFISQRTYTPAPVSTANVGVAVEGDSEPATYTEAVQEAIDAEKAEGYVSEDSIGFCTNPAIFETEDDQIGCISGLVEADQSARRLGA